MKVKRKVDVTIHIDPKTGEVWHVEIGRLRPIKFKDKRIDITFREPASLEKPH